MMLRIIFLRVFICHNTSSLTKCLFKSFAYFLDDLLSYGCVSIVLYIFWIQALYHICDLQILSPSLHLVFSLSYSQAFYKD